jgi:hypothetical protein
MDIWGKADGAKSSLCRFGSFLSLGLFSPSSFYSYFLQFNCGISETPLDFKTSEHVNMKLEGKN